MTREEFIEVLNNGFNLFGKRGYSYREEGDKIVVTHIGDVYLKSLTSLPPSVEFRNGGYVNLESLKTIPPGVQFNNNRGGVFLRSIIGMSFGDWDGNIKGIYNKRLLNVMIKQGVFI